MQLEWLLFDLDNTLLDFSKASKIAFDKTLQKAGIHDSENYIANYHKVNKEAWDAYEEGKLHISDLPLVRTEKFITFSKITQVTSEDFNDIYLDFLSNENHYLPNTESTLSTLKTMGFRMAIVTNGLSIVQRQRWAVTDLSFYFEDIFIGEEIGRPKPHSFFFDVVHGKIGRPNRQKVLIIGDNPVSDIKGGRDYGYKTCFFDQKKTIKKHVKSDLSISNINELNSLIKK